MPLPTPRKVGSYLDWTKLDRQNGAVAEHYTPRQAADVLPYSVGHIRKLLRSGKIRGKRDDHGHWWIAKSEVERKAKELNTEPQKADSESIARGQLTRADIIALIGATGGYIGFLTVLIYPVGSTALWLQIVNSGYAKSMGDAWYAAWLAPQTVVVPNVLLVFLWSLFPTVLLYISVSRQVFQIYALHMFANLDDPGQRQNLPDLYLGYITYFLGFLMYFVPILLISTLLLFAVFVLVDIASVFATIKLFLIIVIPFFISATIAGYLEAKQLERIEREIEGRESEDSPWRARLTQFMAGATVYAATLVAAVYIVGLQVPSLTSMTYGEDSTERILVAHSQSY